MKQFLSQSIVLELSQRELEMIKNALYGRAADYWQQHNDCQWRATGAKTTFSELAEDYQKLADEANKILLHLPF